MFTMSSLVDRFGFRPTKKGDSTRCDESGNEEEEHEMKRQNKEQGISKRREEVVSKATMRLGGLDRASKALTHGTGLGTLCVLNHPSGVV
jgi:hypothetical protein